MAVKGLNHFDECIGECGHMRPQEEEWTSSFWGDIKMCTPGTIANSLKTPTKIKQKWCYCQS